MLICAFKICALILYHKRMRACVQGSRADDKDGLRCDSGGGQAGSHLSRAGYTPEPAQPHDAKM